MTFPPAAPLRRLLPAMLLLALPAALLVAVSPAGAATRDTHPEIVQCFTDFPPAGCSTLGPPDFVAIDAEISPDGKQLYVLGTDATVAVVDRLADGSLAPRTGEGSCFNLNGTGDCTATAALSGFDVRDLSLAPDGKSVYVATRDSLAHLSRDPATGDLTPAACYSSVEVGCVTVPQLDTETTAVIVSPDSLNVYVRGDARLLAFDRAANGALTLKAGAAGCFTESLATGCTDVVGLVGSGYEMAVSPAGSHLYVPNANGVAIFTRGSGGSLSQAGDLTRCVTRDGLSTGLPDCTSLGGGLESESTSAVTISPSGKHVFISGTYGSTVFARNAATGALAKTDCIAWQDDIVGCQNLNGTAGYGVEVSPDGTRAIVGGGDVSGFGVYDFDETTGHLTQLPGQEGCYSGNFTSGCAVIPGGYGGKSVWGPDGLNVYVVPSSSLLNVRQDYTPVCTNASVTVAQGTTASIPLTCSDANGDAITIAATAPGHGSVGAVDQTADTVAYTPTAGYSGSDSFTVTATAHGRVSAPATITISVPATVVPPSPPAADKTVTLTIQGGTIKLNDKDKAKVKLTCPATEKSGPCTGRLTMKTRGKVAVDGKQKIVTLGKATYSIASGSTKKVTIKLTAANAKLVRKIADARKLRLVAKVKDAVGNKATIKQKAKLRITG